MSEKKKNKKIEEKVLAVELKEEIQSLIEKYCKASGIALEDLGFAIGFIHCKVGKDHAALEQLMFLFQLYFFSGVYYAKETKEFGYEMISREEREKKLKEFVAKLDTGLSKKKDATPSYMG